MHVRYLKGRRPARITIAAAASSLALSAGLAVGAQAAKAPTPAKTDGGATAKLYASGMKNVTSMAWGDNAMFAGDSGSGGATPNGGVYVVSGGSAKEVPNGPGFVGGMAWHSGGLYLSDAYQTKAGPSFRIERWSGFNGSTFAKRQVLYTAPEKFQGFNGLAFGPDGRLYVGVDAGLLDGNDHGPATTSPDLYDILSMSATGQNVKVFASGIRQPWQMAFAPGSSQPFVSDLGQDGPASVKNPPDFLLKVRAGQNYGFPTCNFTQASACSGDAKPFKEFPAHTSIMGVAILKSTVYMTSYEGIGGTGGGALLSIPTSGGSVSSVVTGLPIASDALAAHDGDLYVGGSTEKGDGEIYEVTP